MNGINYWNLIKKTVDEVCPLGNRKEYFYKTRFFLKMTEWQTRDTADRRQSKRLMLCILALNQTFWDRSENHKVVNEKKKKNWWRESIPELRTVEKSTNACVALRFFARIHLMIQWIVRIWEVMDWFLWKLNFSNFWSDMTEKQDIITLAAKVVRVMPL